MLNVILLSAITLNFFMLSVVMLSVAAQFAEEFKYLTFDLG